MKPVESSSIGVYPNSNKDSIDFQSSQSLDVSIPPAKDDPNLFSSGHEIFDEILNIHYGSFILILDDTFTEGHRFLQALLTRFRDVPVYEIAKKPILHFPTHIPLEDSTRI